MGDLEASGGFALSQGALERLRGEFDSARVSEEETRETIARVLARDRPGDLPAHRRRMHAARARRGDQAVPMVALATAHPAKFPDAVEAACGIRPALPPRWPTSYQRPERVTHVPNDLTPSRLFSAGRPWRERPASIACPMACAS